MESPLEQGGRAAVGSDEEGVSRGRRKHLRPCPRRCGGPMHLLCTQEATPYAMRCRPPASSGDACESVCMRGHALKCSARTSPRCATLISGRSATSLAPRCLRHNGACRTRCIVWCLTCARRMARRMVHGAWRGAWRLAAPVLHTTPHLAPLHMGFTWSWPVARCFTPCIACPRIAQRATGREHHMLHHTSL